MPRPSAFNSTHFSSRLPHSHLIYLEMVKALGNGENYTEEFNSLAMARVYANARAFGRCKYTLERSGSQFHAKKTLELLPTLEREYGIVPPPGASIEERRSDLTVAMRIARGARVSNVVAVMSELFGADFVAYAPTASADAVDSTADPAAVGLYPQPGTPRSVLRLMSSIVTLNQAITVRAKVLISGTGTVSPLRDGDKFIVDSGSLNRCEAVTATAVVFDGDELRITAVFTKPHTAGVKLATGRHPMLSTTKRHNLLVLSANAAADASQRRRENRAANRTFRGVSTWSVADSSGPFRVGVGRLGITTIGAV